MRCFISYDIPEDIRDVVEELKGKIRYIKGKGVERENLHITVGFLTKKGIPDLNERDVKNVKKILDSLEIKAFELHLKGLELIPTEKFFRVIAIGCEEGKEKFIEMQKEVEKMLRKINIESKWHPPHLTVYRVKVVLDRNLFMRVYESIKDIDLGNVLVDRIILKKSTLTPKGPIYEDLFVKKLSTP